VKPDPDGFVDFLGLLGGIVAAMGSGGNHLTP